MRAFVVIAGAGRQLLKLFRPPGDLSDPPAADVSGRRDTRFRVLVTDGVRGLPEQIAAWCRTLYVCCWARPPR
jgi:hypothetical protein